MEKSKTSRGFSIIKFNDFNDTECNLQESSLATENAIWLGAAKICLKEFVAYEGWKDVELKDTLEHHFVANNRMHLTQEQVVELLPHLTRFAETGEI